MIEACGLLQICPRDILGPIFIEIIQRENRASVKATSPPSSAPLSATNSGVARSERMDSQPGPTAHFLRSPRMEIQTDWLWDRSGCPRIL